MTDKELLALAGEARKRAYAPYSHFAVGAALLCKDGTVYTGCNIENASFTPTVCGERTAFFKAVYDGKRAFTAIAVVGGKEGDPDGTAFPCGVRLRGRCLLCFYRQLYSTPTPLRETRRNQKPPKAWGRISPKG